MLDSKEIAKRALFRADEIQVERKRKRRQLQHAGMISGVCVVVLVIAISAFPMTGLQPGRYVSVESGPIPLSALLLPDGDAKPFTGIEKENILSVVIPAYDTVTVEVDALNAEMMLLNPEGNQCYFSFEIVLQSAGETLYKSGLVAPACYIEKVTLDRELEKGEHEAILIIRTYAADSFTLLSSTEEYFILSAE